MNDFLTFNTFIAQDILIFFYYVGAVIMPVILWFSRDYLLKKVSLFNSVNTFLKGFFESLNLKNKTITIIGFVMIFFCMELCWRMIFEAMIGYFDMHNYLYEISRSLK